MAIRSNEGGNCDGNDWTFEPLLRWFADGALRASSAQYWRTPADVRSHRGSGAFSSAESSCRQTTAPLVEAM